MDTAVLIDYGEHGGAIWADGTFDPQVSDERYKDELLALEVLINLWLTRDIRFHVFVCQMEDARRSLSGERAALREKQIVRIQSALQCLDQGTEHIQPQANEYWPPTPDLTGIAYGSDREILTSAIDAGCHVFLTRDNALLAKADQVDRYWVALKSPVGLLEALAAAGELTPVGPHDGTFPDTHKWAHLMDACATAQEPALLPESEHSLPESP